MLPLRLFRSRNFSVTNIETLAVYGGLSAWSFFLDALPAGGGRLVAAPVRPRDRAGDDRHVLPLAAHRPAVGALRAAPLHGARAAARRRVALSARADAGRVTYWADLLPPLLGFAVGLSLTVAPLTTTVLCEAGPGDAGIASGVNNAVARVAGLVAIAGIGIAASGGGETLTEHGFHIAMAITATLICLGGAIGAIGIRNPPREG